MDKNTASNNEKSNLHVKFHFQTNVTRNSKLMRTHMIGK